MKINVPFTKLKNIAHIADVHIRLFKRHEEYKIVFERLYADLKKTLTDNFVIIVAGDVVHSKTDMSPELVQMTSAFLKNLADIGPTILIAGNHDCNLANSNRMDALSPIVSNLTHPNLFYIRDSSVAYVADTAIAVCSIFDDIDYWPTADEIDPDVATKIALYHGPVQGAVTDTGFKLTDHNVGKTIFDGFDMVLLGDIHTPNQTLQKYDQSKNKPIIHYVGSLIQQNHGEQLGGHGWCIWDVPSRAVSLREIENDFGYLTLNVSNNNLALPSYVPKNARVRMFTENLDMTEVKKLVSKLKETVNVVDISVLQKKMQMAVGSVAAATHTDFVNVVEQNRLLKDWLLQNDPQLPAGVVEKVQLINKKLNDTVVYDDNSRNIRWKPLKFTFSNMFSYGENNSVDFSNMRDVLGLFAPNAAGKSSLIDAVMFCLYDKTLRAYKGAHIMNNRKNTFECELTFEINGEVFVIKRNGTRKKNGDVKIDVNFSKILSSGEIISLNGEERRDTNLKIRSYIGTFEDFVMTAFSGQSSNALFIDKTQTERKDLLIQFMGLHVFDKLHDAANDESKEISGILKRFKKSDVTDQLSQTELLLTSTQDEYNQFQVKHTEIAESQHLVEEQLVKLQEQKKPLTGNFTDIVILRKKLQELADVIKKAQQNHEYTIVKYEAVKQEHDQLTNELSSYDMTGLAESANLYTQLCVSEKQIQSEINLLISKIEEKTRFRNKLSKYTYNPNCEVCIQNNLSTVNDLATSLVDLEKMQAILVDKQQSIQNITTRIKELTVEKFAYDEGIQLQNQMQLALQTRQRLKVELDLAKTTIEARTEQYSKVQTDIDLYELNQSSIIFNQSIDDQMRVVQTEIDRIKKSLVEVNSKLRDYHGKLAVLQAKKDELHTKLTEAETLELTYEAYKHYLRAVGRDGIPHDIIQKTLPHIEAEINNILSQIVDFSVSLEVDEKNINSKLIYSDEQEWPLENCSGMERFITSLVIRVALMNTSSLPKPNFLIIDEGFGVLDADNLHSMSTLFDILRSYFDFILIVSHLDTMRDMVDSMIEIKKSNGYSSIVI